MSMTDGIKRGRGRPPTNSVRRFLWMSPELAAAWDGATPEQRRAALHRGLSDDR